MGRGVEGELNSKFTLGLAFESPQPLLVAFIIGRIIPAGTGHSANRGYKAIDNSEDLVEESQQKTENIPSIS